MEEKFMNLKFYHKGEFQETRYAGGVQTMVMGVNSDLFSYTVLMEHVKDDLKYSEIGGIYISKGKLGGWKLVTNDADLFALVDNVKNGDQVDFYVDTVVDNRVEPLKQMQPHVVIRPRENLYAAKKQVKRKFVTTHQLQQQQRTMKSVEVDKTGNISTRKSPRLNKRQEINDAIVNQGHRSASARRKLDLHIPPHEDENMGENDIEGCFIPPPPPLSDYEKRRALNIKRNNEVCIALNLPPLAAGLKYEMKRSKGKAGLKNEMLKNKGKGKMQEDNEEYVPENEEPSEDEASEIPLKRNQIFDKTKFLTGPTTRSRANVVSTEGTTVYATENKVTNSIPVKDANIELPQSRDGQGSMAAFWAMRKRQKEEALKAAATAGATENVPATEKIVAETVLPDLEDEAVEVEVPKRLRGRTRMDKVHTRGFDKRVVIQMNERFQPISDDDKIISELGSFLGTVAKRCVALTYVTWRDVPETLKKTMWNYVKQRYIIPEQCEFWVLKSIHESWRGYKSRIKAAHYTAYQNDEERLENRPIEIPLENFKMLLEYWGDETV